MAVATTTCEEAGLSSDYLQQQHEVTQSEQVLFLSTHNDDLHRNGEGQFVAVACAQLLHYDQNRAADQCKHQRCDVGLGQATDNIHKSL